MSGQKVRAQTAHAALRDGCKMTHFIFFCPNTYSSCNLYGSVGVNFFVGIYWSLFLRFLERSMVGRQPCTAIVKISRSSGLKASKTREKHGSLMGSLLAISAANVTHTAPSSFPRIPIFQNLYVKLHNPKT